MAYPVSDSYSAASGSVIAGGRYHLGAIKSALDSMNAGQWLDWSASTNVSGITDTTGPGGVAANWLETTGNLAMTNWPGKAAFDLVTKQAVIVGTAQGYASETPAGAHGKAAYFDVTTGQFSSQWNPMGVNIGHIYDGNPSIAHSGKIYRTAYNSPLLFEGDVASRVWTSVADMTSLGLSFVKSVEIFPEFGASGSVLILCDGGKLCRYDISTDALSTIGTYSGIGSYPVIHYCKGRGYVVFGAGITATALYKLDSSGSVAQISNTLPGGLTGIGAQNNCPMVADPSGRAMSWLLELTGSIWSLDHATGAWTEYSALPEGLAINNCAVAVIHGYGALLFLEGAGRASSTVSTAQVWLHKVQ